MGGSVNGLTMKVTRDDMWKLSHLAEVIKQELIAALPKIGKNLEAKLKMHVQNQDLSWVPLNPAYQEWKIKMGYSEDKWLMTSSLFASITSTVKSDTLEVFVGVHRSAGNHVTLVPNVLHGSRAKDSGPMFEIASILEGLTPDGAPRGNSHIPPRPLFQPTLAESKRSIETSVGIAVKKAIKKFT
jgi:hypothetical protein